MPDPASLPPRSAVTLPSQQQRQPFHFEPAASTSENVADLTKLREQVPQRRGENKQAYARRLRMAYPQLTLIEISWLSGVTAGNLRKDPAFRGLPAHLAPFREQVPQRDGEKNPAYARRLHMAYPRLTMPEISLLSGVTEGKLKADPAFQALPAHLTPIRVQIPQRDAENNQAYARRLHMAYAQLTLPEISLLSGVVEWDLKADPAFRALPAHLAPIREQVPQCQGESNQAYARRLHLERPQFTLPEISLLSGVRESKLKADSAFRALPAHLAPIREQFPQYENNQAYARRLHLERPQLTLPEISLLSGVTEGNLKRDPAFGQTPALSTSVEPVNSDGSARRSRPLKRTASEAAAAQQESHAVPVLRSVRSRLTEPSGILALVSDAQARQTGLVHAAPGATTAATPGMNLFATELGAQLAQTPSRAENAGIDAMIREMLLLLPGEHFVAQPQASSSQGQTTSADPATALAAMADAQGRWLNEPTQSDGVAGLSPAKVRNFATPLQHMRANLSQLETFELPPVQTPFGAGPFPGPSLQEHEVEDMIRELLG